MINPIKPNIGLLI